MIKRPVFLAALLLTAVLWIRLTAGGFEDPSPGGAVGGEPEAGDALYVTGQICRKEENKIWLQSVTFTFQDNTFHQTDHLEQDIPYHQKLICEISEETKLPLGSRVVLGGVFMPFSEAANPGEFDSAAYYRSLQAGGRLLSAELLARDGGRWPIREAAWRLRQFLRDRIYRILPQESAGVMCALLLGDRAELDGDLKDLYKRNGILHILSISSLHITIIGMSIYKALRKMGLPVPAAALAGSGALLFYGSMAGFSVSACRAIGMYLLRMGAEMIGRSYDTLTALGILLAAMTMHNPYYLQNAGFLLSFSSVLGIAVIHPILKGGAPRSAGARFYGEKEWRIRMREAVGKVKSAAAASCSITLATLPIQLWYYYETPIYSLAVNLLILPLMKPLLITGLFSLIPGLGAFAWADRGILWIYETVCGLCDRLPFHTWNPGRPATWQVFLYYGILLGAVLLGQKKKGRIAGKRGDCPKQMGAEVSPAIKSGSLGLLRYGLLLLAVVSLGIRPIQRDQVIFLDVGQGDCCLVRTASGENYLFDCGSSSRSGVGQYVLLPCLKYYGIRTLDGVFVSHPDSDHMNGVTELLLLAQDHRIRIRQLLLPAVEREEGEDRFADLLAAAEGDDGADGVRVAWLSAGEAWESGAAEFLCLHPEKGWPAENTNAGSECIYVEFGSFSLLLTGDVEEEGEEALLRELQRREIRAVTVLKVSHHGSRNSTSRELLEQIAPRLAVISCGRNNRYGHPHEELLRRLEDAGCRILTTPERGAVIVEGRRGGVRIWGFRKNTLHTKGAKTVYLLTVDAFL
ncbi:MAG: ComEC/Rec2 family competence protein [Roseburia sp.]|nr:ComEC/Rec2 family competence protein [Roseburia sp.]MCM1098664.1 ComEC/Rec2 family competence protein [Ruminococcus flavefaciens]